MLALLVSSLLSLFLFLVFGTIMLKIAKVPANLAEKLLVGLAVTNTLSTLISLFYPVDGFCLALLITCCLCLLFWVRRELTGLFVINPAKKTVLLIALPFIITAFIISLSAPTSYDAALYHIQAIKWIEAYPAVPGLANLHGRFGYNPNIFTLFALTSLFDLFKQEIFSINFTAFAIFSGYFSGVVYRLLKQKGINGYAVFFMLVYLAIILLYDNLPSPSPDFLAVATPLFIFARTIELSGNGGNLSLKSFSPVIILCFYILTTKLATLPLLLLVVLLLLKYKPELKKQWWLIPLTALMVIPWLLRNVILSGWLIYPFPSLNLFSFDWQVPVAKVISEHNAITGWARLPRANFMQAAQMGIATWAPQWWNLLSLAQKLLFLGGLICPLLTFAWQIFRKKNAGFLQNAITATAFVGLIFWFFLAPDFRFGQAFVVTAALSALLLLKQGAASSAKPLFKLIPLMAIFLGLQLFTGRHYLVNATRQISSVAIKPQRIQIPGGLTYKFHYLEGIIIYYPSVKDECFDHFIPCEPHEDTAIVLRGHILRKGFKPAGN